MLHIISTPIGNMRDITYRAVEILNSVDMLFCEDTRVTNKLLDYYNIKKALYIYNDFSKDIERQKIIEKLKDGKNIGLVSDAGTPLISDPGYKLVKECHKNNLKVIAVCGASAVLTSLVASGMPTSQFLFYGFLESKKSLESLKYRNETIIIYEGTKKLLFTLKDILEILGDIDICVCKELTKIYENIKSGKVSEVINFYENNKNMIKGEFVILLKNNINRCEFDVDKINYIVNSLKDFMKPKEIADFISKIDIADKKKVYNFIIGK